MKKILLLFVILLGAGVYSHAQVTVVTISGQVVDSSSGQPIANQYVEIYSDSTISNSVPAGFSYSSYTYTDSNGMYSFIVEAPDSTNGYYTSGTLQVYIYDCSNTSIDSALSFSSGNINLTQNFSICRSCYGSVIVSNDSSVANGLGYHFDFASTDTITSIVWDFGDSTSDSTGALNVNHTYAVAGSYNVCALYSTSFGCTNSSCQYITVYANCTASYTANVDTTVSNSMAFNFAFSSSDSITSLSWDFGDGLTGSDSVNQNHIFAAPGNYVVCASYTTSTGCNNSFCDYVNVGNYIAPVDDYGCDASFSFTSLGAGEFSLTDESFPNTTGTDHIVNWSWDFGDGTTSTAQNPTHTYMSHGSYSVNLTIFTAEGCSSALIMPIESDTVIVGTCQSDFEMVFTPGQPFTYTLQEASLSENPSQVITSYFWNFGDGTTSTVQDPMHTYSLAGVYHITHTITTTTGCVSIYTENLVVDSACYMYLVASTIANESTAGASNGEIDVDVVGTAPFVYSWSNGATSQNLTGLASGYYNVWVTDVNGCTTWATFDVLINADSLSWNYVDTLLETSPIDTCLTFIPTSASIYSYVVTGNSIDITWIEYDSTETLHAYVTDNYVFDTTSYSGYYTVVLTVTCDSFGRTNPLVHTFIDRIHIGQGITGVVEKAKTIEEVSLYPNPVVDNLSIAYTISNADQVSIEIVNMLGQVIKTERNNTIKGKGNVTINTSNLENGIYFMTVRSNEKSITRRFVKN